MEGNIFNSGMINLWQMYYVNVCICIYTYM